MNYQAAKSLSHNSIALPCCVSLFLQVNPLTICQNRGHFLNTLFLFLLTDSSSFYTSFLDVEGTLLLYVPAKVNLHHYPDLLSTPRHSTIYPSNGLDSLTFPSVHPACLYRTTNITGKFYLVPDGRRSRSQTINMTIRVPCR